MPPKRVFRKKRPSSARGLNKKEKSQVVKIAKKSIQTVAEKKFMNSAQFEDENLVPAHTNSPIAVIGYSTTEDVNVSGAAVMYGQTQVKEGLCLQPFLADEKDDTQEVADLGRYAVIGKSVMPRTCHSRWRFQRRYSALDNDGEQLDGDSHPFVLPSTINGIADSLPIYFRVLKVTTKGQAGSSITHDPGKDLFLDKYGQPTGVTATNLAGNFVFTEQDLLFCKANSRKYQVIEDKRFTLRNPLTLQWIPQLKNQGSPTGVYYLPNITNTNGNCEKYFNFNHQLTKRKGGKIHYNEVTVQDPDTPTNTIAVTNATSGMRREYVFVHAIYQGANLDGMPFEPTPVCPDRAIKWSLMNSTTFTDV